MTREGIGGPAATRRIRVGGSTVRPDGSGVVEG